MSTQPQTANTAPAIGPWDTSLDKLREWDPDWAARLNGLPPGRSKTVTVGKEVALFNVDGVIYAMEDGCLHHGVSLANSDFEGKVVTRLGHSGKYDVTACGTLHVPDYGVATYPVKVVDGKFLQQWIDPVWTVQSSTCGPAE